MTIARTAKTAWCGGIASRSMAIEGPAIASRGSVQRVGPTRRPFSRARLDRIELPVDSRDLLVRSRATA